MAEDLITRIDEMRERMATGKVGRSEMTALLGDVREALTGADGLANALQVASYSETMAIREVARALPEQDGGLVVSSAVAGAAAVTRSTVVNAIRILQAAGVVQAWSQGMRGTMIRLRGMTRDQLVERVAAAGRTA